MQMHLVRRGYSGLEGLVLETRPFAPQVRAFSSSRAAVTIGSGVHVGRFDQVLSPAQNPRRLRPEHSLASIEADHGSHSRVGPLTLISTSVAPASRKLWSYVTPYRRCITISRSPFS